MKARIQYNVITDTGHSVFFDDLLDARRYKDEIEKRGTGKTTKKLFKALAQDFSIVFIVSPNQSMALSNCKKMKDMLETLGFEHQLITQYNISNNGRIFKFVSEQFIDNEKNTRGLKDWTCVYDLE